MRARYNEDIGEKAYYAWKECGYNVRKAARRLASEGLAIHRDTISAWRDRCGWKIRALREGHGDRVSEAKNGIAAGLEAEKERYEKFFITLDPAVIDVQATYAYTALVKAIADVHKKTDPEPDVYAMSPVVMDEFGLCHTGLRPD